MLTIIIALLISFISYIYFQKNKYIELPDVKENLENVHIFNSSHIEDKDDEIKFNDIQL
jgi:hypothetical protein